MSIEYHEPPESLQPETRDIHRALSTLAEELEAVDWYQHRIDVSNDQGLIDLFKHNRNEEFEHAAMTLEWLRRKIPAFDAHLRTYLFTERPIVAIEDEEEAPAKSDGAGTSPGSSLGLGSLKEGA